jgi:hypothetical protein
MPVLHGWESFYAIVGASAGALIGLQFVLLTLIAMTPVERAHALASGAFGTPTVVHFGVVLSVSAFASAPLESTAVVASLWGLIGLGGVVYSAVVARRMRAQNAYKPVLEDWLFYVLVPCVAYVLLAGAALGMRSDVRVPSLVGGAATLLLLLVGIRNAWDAVTHYVFVRRIEATKSDRSKDESPSAK